MTVMELLDHTARYFARHEVPSPRLTVELMLAEVLQKSRMELYLSFDQALEESVLERMRPLVKRRAEGEPLEYLLGTTTFAGHRVLVSPGTLIPRPETEILLEAAISLIEPQGLPVLDVGTGSGILSLALARKFPHLEIFGTDISPAALETARSNTKGLGNIHLFESNLMENAGLPERFQMIVANLPYIPTDQMAGLMREVQHEPKLALDGGQDGLELIRRLVTQSAGRTHFLALEIGDGQAEVAKTLCESAGYTLNQILPDFTARQRILVANYYG